MSQFVSNKDVSPNAAIEGTKIVSDFGAQDIFADGYIALGLVPASVGDIRLENNVKIAFRNSGNLDNIIGLYADASNNVNIGAGSAAVNIYVGTINRNVLSGTGETITLGSAQQTGNTTIYAGSATDIVMTSTYQQFRASSQIIFVAGSAYPIIAESAAIIVGVPSIRFEAAQVSPKIWQNDDATNGITGDTLTIQAQNTTGTTSTGGEVRLQSGAGTSTNGFVTAYVGSTQAMQIGLSTADFIKMGDVPAASGYLRVDDSWALKARNGNPGTADRNLLSTSGEAWALGDAAQTGAGVIRGTTLQLIGGIADYFDANIIYFRPGDAANNGISIAGSTGTINVEYTAASPTISQTTHATTPHTFTIRAQNVTTGTGSDLVLNAGTGSIANGTVKIGYGAVVVGQIGASQSFIRVGSLNIVDGQSSGVTVGSTSGFTGGITYQVPATYSHTFKVNVSTALVIAPETATTWGSVLDGYVLLAAGSGTRSEWGLVPSTGIALGGANQVLWSNGTSNSWTGAPTVTSLGASSYVALGASPSGTGSIRLSNGGRISAKSSDGYDRSVIDYGATLADFITVGNDSTAQLYLRAATSGTLYTNGASFSWGAGYVVFEGTTAYTRTSLNITPVSIPAGTGHAITIKAGTGGASQAGGTLTLRGGDPGAGGTNGPVLININGTVMAQWSTAATDYVATGATPSSQGQFRLDRSTTGIYYRNWANTGDVQVFGGYTDDALYFGAGTSAGSITAGAIALRVPSGAGSAGGLHVYTGGAALSTATTAQSGVMRVTSSFSLYQRNTGGTADRGVIVCGGESVTFGDSNQTGNTTLRGAALHAYAGSTQVAQLGLAGTDFIKAGGASVASAGILRCANSTTAVAFRNAANTADIAAVAISSDTLDFGSANSSSVYFTTGGAGLIYLRFAGVAAAQFASSYFQWDRAVSNPTLRVQQRDTDAATTSFTIQAQSAWASAVTNIDGGSLYLRAGSAATGGTDGSIYFGNATGTLLQVYKTSTYCGITPGTLSTSGFGFYANGTGQGFFVQATSATGFIELSARSLMMHYAIGANPAKMLVYGSTWTLEIAAATGAPLLKHVAPGSDVAPANFTIEPQPAYTAATGANRTPGSLIVALATPTNSGTNEAALKITRGGSFAAQIAPLDSAPTTYTALWLTPTTAPTTTNYSLAHGAGVLYANSATSINMIIGGSATSGVSVSASTVSMYPANLQWDSTVVAPKLWQANDATNGITGDALTIQAQNATGTTSTGGEIQLRSGTGTSANGVIKFYSGNTLLGQTYLAASTYWGFSTNAPNGLAFYATSSGQGITFVSAAANGYVTFSSDTVTLGFNAANYTLTFLGAGTSVKISQATHATNARLFTIQAGNVTTGTGSDLKLQSGTGSVAAGAVQLFAGEDPVITAKNKNLALFDATGSFGSGVGVVYVKDRTTAPTTNPSNGGLLYSEGGELFWRSSSGVVTQLTP